MPQSTKRKRAAQHDAAEASERPGVATKDDDVSSSDDDDVEDDEPWAGAGGGAGRGNDDDDNDDGDDDDDDDDDGYDETELEFVNAEFDSMQASPDDFHGIRTLLHQVG